MAKSLWSVQVLPRGQVPALQAIGVVDALCDAFHEYPVMRYILGREKENYSRRLHTLVNFFVMARVWRQEPVLAVTQQGQNNAMAAAVAILTLPAEQPAPVAVAEHREQVWQELGTSARARYERYGDACEEFSVSEPNYHLNMIGVRHAFHGYGLARLLMTEVHNLSLQDPVSRGVTLSTENSDNISFYEHFGYRVIGHTRVSDSLETWSFYRPDTTL